MPYIVKRETTGRVGRCNYDHMIQELKSFDTWEEAVAEAVARKREFENPTNNTSVFGPDNDYYVVLKSDHFNCVDRYFVESDQQRDDTDKGHIYRLVCVRNGQYGFVHRDNERYVCDHPFKTYEEAYMAAERRYLMLKHCPGEHDLLEGTPEDFTITVKNTEKAEFSDHYFIEEG
ncbi:MAG: hypothetical protein IKW99_05720 [Bacteroidales bacterium]|nr:hypothetical protein [Bacteroidales bacterium]